MEITGRRFELTIKNARLVEKYIADNDADRDVIESIRQEMQNRTEQLIKELVQ